MEFPRGFLAGAGRRGCWGQGFQRSPSRGLCLARWGILNCSFIWLRLRLCRSHRGFGVQWEDERIKDSQSKTYTQLHYDLKLQNQLCKCETQDQK